MGRPIKYDDAASWDWSKSDIELSRELKIAIATLRYTRRRLGIAPVAAPNAPSRKKAERSVWDWSKSNVELACAHKITRERVRQIRSELGLPARSEEGGPRSASSWLGWATTDRS